MSRIWFNRRRLQWWRVLRVSLLWIGIGVVAVVVLQPKPKKAPAEVVTADTSASLPAVTQGAAATLLAHVRPASAPAGQASTTQIASASTGMVEVCGVGRVKATADDPDGYKVLEAHHSPGEVDAWLGTLIQGGDERARAAALLLRGGEAHERLALLAARSNDAVVYAYALQACRTWEAPARAGACRAITPEHWAQLDAGNAMVWLFAANAARVRGDTAAVAEAMRRAAQADTYRHPGTTLVRSLLPEEPRNLSRAQTALVLAHATGLQAALPHAHYTVLATECGDASLAVPARRETCSRIAERMVAGADALPDMAVGLRMGERLGWPKERVAELRAQLQVLGNAHPWIGTEGWSCGKVDQMRRYMINVARVGERAALTEAAAAAGMTLEEVARRNRRHLEAVRASMPRPAETE